MYRYWLQSVLYDMVFRILSATKKATVAMVLGLTNCVVFIIPILLFYFNEKYRELDPVYMTNLSQQCSK